MVAERAKIAFMTNPLRAFLTLNNTTASAFAQKIDVSPSFLSRLMTGEREADATILGKIEKGTGGKVRPDMWVRWWRGTDFAKERA